MKRHSFITKIPVHSGSLHRAVEIVAAAGGNINRIHYDRKIEPQTVFWEITCEDTAFECISCALAEIGYLQTGLAPVASLQLTIRLPHESGSLNKFLHFITESKAIITAVAFDDEGSKPDTVTISVVLEENERAQALTTVLSRVFELVEIQFEGLEDTSFYVQFAETLSKFVPDPTGGAVVDLVAAVNRVAQDLRHHGRDPKAVFTNVLEAAQTIADTCDAGYFADIQSMPLSDKVQLHCIQPPCGGNIYLFEMSDHYVMLDTGYGAHHPDLMRLFSAVQLQISPKLSKILLSHGDTDHCGAAGFFDVPIHMHSTAWETIRSENRAWGSPREDMLLETVYSKMIAAFSKVRPPVERNISLLATQYIGSEGAFRIMTLLDIGDLQFEVLESLGGHQVGSIFLFCKASGFLFTADSLVPVHAISPERTRYNRVADFLMTSVNVDSETAGKERRALLEIAAQYRRKNHAPCTVFCGHGPICIEQDGQLHVAGPTPMRYTHRCS